MKKTNVDTIAQAKDILKSMFINKAKQSDVDVEQNKETKISIFDVAGVSKNTSFDQEFLKNHFPVLTRRVENKQTQLVGVEMAIDVNAEAGLLYKLELEIGRFAPGQLGAFKQTDSYKKYFDENGLVFKAKEIVESNALQGISDDKYLLKNHDNLKEKLKIYKDEVIGGNTIDFKTLSDNPKAINSVAMTIGASDPKVIGSLMLAADDRGQDGKTPKNPKIIQATQDHDINKMKNFCMKVAVILCAAATVGITTAIGTAIGGPIGAAIGAAAGIAIGMLVQKKLEAKLDQYKKSELNPLNEKTSFTKKFVEAANSNLKNEHKDVKKYREENKLGNEVRQLNIQHHSAQIGI